MTTLKFGGGHIICKNFEYPIVFTVGGILYMLIEILWRGYTHWSMGICAGICFVGIYFFEQKFPKANWGLKCLFGALFITTNELVIGCIVNILLGWNVWDYSSMPLNLLGQICLPYISLWYLLCIPAFPLAKGLKKLFDKKMIEIEGV